MHLKRHTRFTRSLISATSCTLNTEMLRYTNTCVKTVIFDKTGTLTVGKPEVVNAVLFSHFSIEEFCNIAAAAEANSEHPIAKSVVEYTKRLHQKLGSHTENARKAKDFEVHTGAGVSGKIGARIVLVGNRRLMLACHDPVDPEVEDYILKNEQLA